MHCQYDALEICRPAIRHAEFTWWIVLRIRRSTFLKMAIILVGELFYLWWRSNLLCTIVPFLPNPAMTVLDGLSAYTTTFMANLLFDLLPGHSLAGKPKSRSIHFQWVPRGQLFKFYNLKLFSGS